MQVSTSGNITRDAVLSNPGEEQRQVVRFRIMDESLTPAGVDAAGIDVVMFGRQAANVADRAKKGRRAFVQGDLRAKQAQGGGIVTAKRSYTTNGEERTVDEPVYEIIARSIFGIDIPNVAASTASSNGSPEPVAAGAPTSEDVPF